MGKINFCGVLIAGVACLMSSCLGSDNVTSDDWNLSNAQIASFSLSNDSIAGLSDVVFTIDQVNGRIYNKDSMPYGTVIDEKVFCAMSFEVGVTGVLMVTPATNDSVYWSSEDDSVNFSSPVMITTYAYDGVSTKTYEAKINIHQVDPDSMVWNLYSGLIPGKSFEEMKVIPYGDFYYMYASERGVCRLYKTGQADLTDWTEILLSGFPAKAVLSQITEYGGVAYVFDTDGVLYRSVDGQTWSQVEKAPYIKALLGFIPEGSIGREVVLSAVSEVDETLRFVAANKDAEWRTGNEVPASFPLSGFGMLNYEVMYYPYLTISSGRDGNNKLSAVTWSTMDGLSWIPLTNERMTFTEREGAAFFCYDDLLYISGGMDESGTALNDVYCSKDRGVTWQQDTIHVMPDEYTARGFSSIDVDGNDFVLLFGGKAGKDTNVLNELWRGRINRLGFMKD
ncbi:MAG: DUF6242 domain-containing protein [Tannerella sp.]|jgi:hypothetical protein|nr:DUF6242 domain-containing protein [Tannerella sp.]